MIFKRHQEIAYVAELAFTAFLAAQGLVDRTTAETRQVALTACARISATDPIGGDLEDVREIAAANLAARQFRSEAVSLFLDDLILDATRLAREERRALTGCAL